VRRSILVSLLAVPGLLGSGGVRSLTAQIDLVIERPSKLTVTPTQVQPGQEVTLPEYVVMNRGTTKTPPFHIGWYLSTDATITSADLRLGGTPMGPLEAGKGFLWGGPTVRIPPGTPARIYFIGILVDELNEVSEGFPPGGPAEANNFIATELRVYGFEYDYVTAVTAGDDEYVWISVKGHFSSGHGCQHSEWARSKNKVTDERTKSQMTVALTSLVTRRMVYVETEGCTVGPPETDGYPILTAIQIHQE
jgi:hypothetical protein